MILPLTSKINNKKNLTIGGNDVIELGDKYGTPLYIMDIEAIKKQCRSYRENFSFPDIDTDVIYAGKAFLCTAMCQLIEKEGPGLDVSSGGELFIALNSGFPPERIYFHGNNKSPDEIKYGLESGTGYFMVDNFTELEMLGKFCSKGAKRQKIMLRVNPGIKADTHEYIQTGKLNSKFGFGIHSGAALEAVKRVKQYDGRLELTGIHAHIGSQIFNISCYEKLVEVMIKFIKDVRDGLGILITGINIGGGLGIKYTSDDRPSNIEDLAVVVHNAVVKYSRKFNVRLDKLYIEPGRSIVGNAGVTLYKAGTVKEVNDSKKYIIVDGGMSDNIRPMLYQAKYTACVANKMDGSGSLGISDNSNDSEVSKMHYTIAGKHCESGDIIISDIELPAVSEGDFIVVATTGAYCYSMSSNYNGQPKSAIVAVEDGKNWLWVKRQTYKDLVMGDIKLYEK
ncbi:MAG: diaminopimelate decarboxylase [Actinomycetota bacterium]|nr:diaminopimelate decarboxylase [Actinomycetota bacterium]